MSKSDPIRTNYYDAVERADKLSDVLFYASAFLSITSLLVDKTANLIAYNVVLTSFALSVFALFALGLVSRLYWTPRAEDKRRQDFFASACGVSLSHQKTDGYYNNDFAPSNERMAAQLLENSHFSKAITLHMARTERIKVVCYAAIWLIVLLLRDADLGLVVAASQAVFSEQILSKYLRLEWLRMRFEKTYGEIYRMFRSKPTTQGFNAMTLESLGMYETAKATAGITLSSTLFERMNGELSAEWEQIKVDLGI